MYDLCFLNRTVIPHLDEVIDTRNLSCIDACDVALARAVAKFHTRRNALVPIMKLPDEVLDRVIHELYGQMLEGAESRRALIEAMHQFGNACARFRGLVLGRCAPWNTLPILHNRALTLSVLEHIPQANPLKLCIEPDYPPWLDMQPIDEVVRLARQPITALVVDIDAEEDDAADVTPGAFLVETLPTLYSGLLASLRTLSVDFRSLFSITRPTPAALLAFQGALKAQCFSAIEDLTILGCWNTALSDLPQNVRSLELGDPQELWRSPDAAMAALGALRRLEKLTLRMKLEYVDEDLKLPSTECRPQFESLRTLAIQAPWYIVTLFFGWSNIVPACDVEIEAFRLKGGPEEVAINGVAALCAYWDSHGVKVFTEISVLRQSRTWGPVGDDILRAVIGAPDPKRPMVPTASLAVSVATLTPSSADSVTALDMLSEYPVVQGACCVFIDGGIFPCTVGMKAPFTTARKVTIGVKRWGGYLALGAVQVFARQYPELRVLEIVGLCIGDKEAREHYGLTPLNEALDALLGLKVAIDMRFIRCTLCTKAQEVIQAKTAKTSLSVVLLQTDG